VEAEEDMEYSKEKLGKEATQVDNRVAAEEVD
jgi:hypothetical protein